MKNIDPYFLPHYVRLEEFRPKKDEEPTYHLQIESTPSLCVAVAHVF